MEIAKQFNLRVCKYSGSCMDFAEWGNLYAIKSQQFDEIYWVATRHDNKHIKRMLSMQMLIKMSLLVLLLLLPLFLTHSQMNSKHTHSHIETHTRARTREKYK